MLVVIGAHSPKFQQEKDPRALIDAVCRYGVAHRVLDGPELATWEQYAARAWLTLFPRQVDQAWRHAVLHPNRAERQVYPAVDANGCRPVHW